MDHLMSECHADQSNMHERMRAFNFSQKTRKHTCILFLTICTHTHTQTHTYTHTHTHTHTHTQDEAELKAIKQFDSDAKYGEVKKYQTDIDVILKGVQDEYKVLKEQTLKPDKDPHH